MANAVAVTGLVTFKDAKARIGILPTLEPRPNATNIRALKKVLVEALQTLPRGHLYATDTWEWCCLQQSMP